jgi:predicted RecA/RadA family phage recombinase
MPADFEAQLVVGQAVKVKYTPGSAVAAGTVVVLNSVPFIAERDIAANRIGALAAGGAVYRCEPAAAIAVGKPVWWDNTNNVVTETATSNTHFGFTVGASYESNTLVDVMHQPQGLIGAIV